jgi:flavin-dependent dehydrogenase
VYGYPNEGDDCLSQGKAIIIGASTAGLFAAYLLAKERIPIELYDERENLGEPSRTLIVTSKLTEVLGFVPHEAILNKVNRIELISAHRHASVGLQEPDLVIERQKLVELLARKARQEGAEIHLSFRFLAFHDEGDGLVLSLQDLAKGTVHNIAAKVLIGADGVLSKVAKAASRDSRETVAIVQAKIVLPEKASRDCVKVWFDRERTQFFYWLIPESESRAVIGLVSRNAKSARESMEEFLRSLGCKTLELQAAQVHLHNPLLEPSLAISNSRILLIGDAGGQVKATTVGGVVAGLRGARAAVKAIAGQAPYGKTLRPLKAELDLHSMMRVILNRFGDQDYDRLLELLDARTGNVLAAHNRDEFKSAFLRLLLIQPRFLLLAAKSLLHVMKSVK